MSRREIINIINQMKQYVMSNNSLFYINDSINELLLNNTINALTITITIISTE